MASQSKCTLRYLKEWFAHWYAINRRTIVEANLYNYGYAFEQEFSLNLNSNLE